MLPLWAALGFGLAGPVVGSICILLALGLIETLFTHRAGQMVLRAQPDVGELVHTLGLIVTDGGLVVRLAYLFGALPAAITGFLAGVLLRRSRSRLRFLAICAIGGAIMSGIASILVTGKGELAITTALAGAAATLILCGLLQRLTRSYAPGSNMQEGS
jgi:hypothetical protein